jgi:hypothetical protein
MQTIIYIGPKPEKRHKGFLFPFGKKVQVPDPLAVTLLAHGHLFTADPKAVPNQRPAREELLRAEIADAKAYWDHYRDEQTFARAEKDPDQKKQRVASCQREMDWAKAKIERCRLELQALAGETSAEVVDPDDDEPVVEPPATGPKINTGTPVETTA